METDEKDQVEEAAKTKQNAEYTLTAITYDPILKTKTPNNTASLDAKLQEAKEREQEQDREALHCSRCRGDFTTTWSRKRHRLVN